MLTNLLYCLIHISILQILCTCSKLIFLFQTHVPIAAHLAGRAGPSRGVLRAAGTVARWAAALALGGRGLGSRRWCRASVTQASDAAS